jgi:hypothetical protein
MTNTTNATTLARGLGRRAYRAGRPLHLTVSETLAAHPGLDAADIRRGWYAERDEQRADVYDPSAIGGGL